MEGLQLIYDSRGVYLWLGLLILFVLLAAWVALLQLRVGSVVSHYRRLMRGVGGGNLDKVLEAHLGRLDATAAKLDEVAEYSRELNASLQCSLQRVGIVRFNPFNDVGGDQSFSVALLDAKGDGLVMTSLFGRQDSRTYLKPVEKGQSKYALSDEETHALRLAHGQGVKQAVRLVDEQGAKRAARHGGSRKQASD